MGSKPLAVYRYFLKSLRTDACGHTWKGEPDAACMWGEPGDVQLAVFKGDDAMRRSAQQEVRTRFKATADVTDPHAIEMLCAEGRDAADFLMQNVVQAQLNDRGNYAMTVEQQHVGSVAEEAALRPDRPPP